MACRTKQLTAVINTGLRVMRIKHYFSSRGGSIMAQEINLATKELQLEIIEKAEFRVRFSL